MAQQNSVAKLTAKVLQLNSDMKVLKQTVYLLKFLIGTQLFRDQTEIEAFVHRFAEAEKTFDPDRDSLDATLRILREGVPISES